MMRAPVVVHVDRQGFKNALCEMVVFARTWHVEFVERGICSCHISFGDFENQVSNRTKRSNAFAMPKTELNVPEKPRWLV